MILFLERPPMDPDRPRSVSGPPEDPSPADDFFVTPPVLSLPKGGGAIRGIGETFTTNPVTGTATVTVPIAISPGRAGFGPRLSLGYDSGGGNGPFGLGWNLSVPDITRRTDRGLPRYDDGEDATDPDVFLLAGAEDLVPVRAAGEDTLTVRVANHDYLVRRYRPRVEGIFALIERWTEVGAPANVCWRTISRDNVTSWFGRDPAGRVADPNRPRRIFRWLLTETHDDRGNVVVYEYIAEDTREVEVGGLAERSRPAAAHTANRYLKTIRYGNRRPYRPTMAADATSWPLATADSAQQWMFTIVLDYGDHQTEAPALLPDQPWPARTDRFSRYRSGFEVRTHRLCRRILMFHSFPEDPSVGADCLVRSTDLEYREPTDLDDPEQPGYTVLAGVTHRGYRRAANGTYTSRRQPPVTFDYQRPTVDRTVRVLDPHELVNAPVGTDGGDYRFVDLDGDGLSGILAEQAGAWLYKPNLGGGRFGPMRTVARAPAGSGLATGRQQLVDVAGEGLLELVAFGGPEAGRHTREPDGGWGRFEPFRSHPNLDWAGPDVHLVDLTGDGRADVLTATPEAVTWYESRGGDGFGPALRAPPDDDDAGPRRVLCDRSRTVFLADMSGDGLADLVQIDAEGVRYRPNLGFGAFGREIVLAVAARLDLPERFDPRRVRLADVDDTGPADLVYLGDDGARLYVNRSGNSLSAPLTLDLPVAGDGATVQVADLFGAGTACLVWNSALPNDAARPVRYVDLMANGKPHLLVRVDNNLGGTVEVEYTPSTRFAVADRLAGTPWLGRLPFPVHCATRVTRRDRWRGTAFTSRFTYHHGCYYGTEREFRGFGRVEQVDTEDYGTFAAAHTTSPYVSADRRLFQPPIKTVTWLHPGATADPAMFRETYAAESFPARWTASGFQELAAPPIELPTGLTAAETREALRACAGALLRQEVFELDGGLDTPVRLLSVRATSYAIDLVQPRAGDRHAVLLVTERETITYQHDLALPAAGGIVAPDPRVAHTLHLRRDDLGQPVQTVTVDYPRRGAGRPAGLPAGVPGGATIAALQSRLDMRYVETRRTADVVVSVAAPTGRRGAVRHRRLRLPWETRAYALSGITPPASGYFAAEDLLRYRWCEDSAFPPVVRPGEQEVAVTHLAFHQRPAGPGAYARVLGRTRTRYFQDEDGISTPVAPHAFGRHGPRGIVYEGYRLALTDGLLDAVFGGADDKLAGRLEVGGATVRESLTQAGAGGYVDGSVLDPAFTGQYWARTGIAGFGPDAADGFYLPERYTGPFGAVTTIGYDKRRLFATRAIDPIGNTTTVERLDLRVLVPAVVLDANGNRTAVAHDALGRVVAAATQGKPRGAGWQGDRLDGLDLDPAPTVVAAFCAGPTQDDAQARSWLGGATTRFVYDLGEGRDVDGTTVWAARMPAACAIRRERHEGQLSAGETSPIRVAAEYADGSGAVLLSKAQAESDPQTGRDRWLVSGLTVLNNKGNPVKRYEPAFTLVFGPESPPSDGVCTVMTYDGAGRVVRTDHPDGTFSRVEISPWIVVNYDGNDTVRQSDWYARRGSPDPAQYLPTGATADKRAAWLAARHADTPRRTVLDAAGREVAAVAHHRGPDDTGAWTDEFRLTYTAVEADGGPLWIRDPRGNLVEQFVVPPKADNDATDDVPTGSCPAYDLAGTVLFRHGMDDGDRWMLPDAAGQPMVSWDVNDRTTGAAAVAERRLSWTRYDAGRRPTKAWLRLDAGPSILVRASEYADTGSLSTAALAAARSANLVGQPVRHYDPGGMSTIDRVGIDGDVEERTRTIVADVPADTVDWNRPNREALLATDDTGLPDTHREITERDALSRPTTIYHWHRGLAGVAGASDRVAVSMFDYDRRGELRTRTLLVQARLRTGADGMRTATPHQDANKTLTVVTEITRNARGQRLTIKLGNGTVTAYQYDPDSFRLTRQHTTRPAVPPASADVQDLAYTYDAVGNITRLVDDAQDPAFNANTVVTGASDFVYDASYRLVEATGRENAAVGPPPHPEGPWPVVPIPSPPTTRAYTQRFRYDAVGNLRRITHIAAGGGWTRNFEPVAAGNRLARSWNGTAGWDNTAPADRVTHRHDRHGNMLNLAATTPATDIRWGWADTIRSLDLQGGGTAYYAYDGDGQRIAKRLVRLGGDIVERIYLDGFERFRRRVGGKLVDEIETFRVADELHAVLQVDDVLVAPAGQVRTLPRYQYGNHLGSVTVELDGAGLLITREEFHPYGTTAFRLQRSGIEVPAKRYRFTGMERDEETGLGYHAARYYAASLGRWTAADPAGPAAGTNRYAYCDGAPTMAADPSGLAGFIDAARLAQRFAGSLLEDAPPEAPPPPTARAPAPAPAEYTNAAIEAIDAIATGLERLGNYLDPPPVSASSQFAFPLGNYGTYIDRQVARSYAAAQSNLDTIFQPSVVETASDRAAAVPALVFNYVGYLAAGVFYFFEHVGADVLTVAGEVIEAVPGLQSLLEGLQAMPVVGPEFGLLARGSLVQLRYAGRGTVVAEALYSVGRAGDPIPPTGVAFFDAPAIESPLYSGFVRDLEARGFKVRPTVLSASERAFISPGSMKMAFDKARFTVLDMLHETFHLHQFDMAGSMRLGKGMSLVAARELEVYAFERLVLRYARQAGETVSPTYMSFLRGQVSFYRPMTQTSNPWKVR
jgi:RHS repeat-associated protein